MIHLYTDGAAKGNPGNGGYGVVLKSGPHYKELSEGFRLTTNNRMELLAVIKGLEEIKTKGSNVLVVSDSKYVTEAVDKGWLWNWIRIGFKGKKNKDLWIRFVNIYRQHQVKFQWIKGHNGHVENERCDQLAVAASENKVLLIDQVYEDEKNSDQLFNS
ncbi:MAG: ribonuclease HI [Sphingobacteriales bacterium]|jgi:ribonuclease HI|nr:ribonuclease HI [Sphingobacteriales bacterium]